MNESTARMIARGRANHNNHVRAGKPGKCCMYCQNQGLVHAPPPGIRWADTAGQRRHTASEA